MFNRAAYAIVHAYAFLGLESLTSIFQTILIMKLSEYHFSCVWFHFNHISNTMLEVILNLIRHFEFLLFKRFNIQQPILKMRMAVKGVKLTLVNWPNWPLPMKLIPWIYLPMLGLNFNLWLGFSTEVFSVIRGGHGTKDIPSEVI